MERVKRAVCLLLCLVMVVGMLPMSAFAATADDPLTAALTEAKDYIDALTVNNSANDPSEVVSKFGTHFTWDNEKRESNSKVSYLYDWSYYNGVVFEGLQYLYEVTGKEIYKNYVIEYLSAMIDANGNWAVCTNNSEKTAAGYVDYHGADCYKTASLLLDAYDLTGDERYKTMAKELYLDLNKADNENVVILGEDAGYNYRHTWQSDPDLDLWLDGLYMILPFRAEYAAYTNNTAELKLIVDRLSWVSENMYNDDDGLFYHAANSDDENSGTYWLRSIGWYAAAIADVMDSVSEEDREELAEQLEKLADGLWDRQGINGMWLNNLAAAESESNPYETSGTALVCYAILKAVNNGWIEEAYADMAIKGFVGICENKLDNDNLTDICFKGVPGGSNSTYYDNEGKGVGPFIMLTAEVQEYVNHLSAEPEETEPTEPELTDIRVAYTRETLLGAELKLNVYAVYSDGTEVLLSEDQYTVFGYNPNKTGSHGIVVTYGNFSRGFNVVILDSGVTVLADNLSGLTATDVTKDETVAAAMAAVETNGFVAYDFTANTNAAVVSIPVPAEWAEGKLVAYYIDENGTIAETIPAEYANGKAVFEVNHFSTYAVSNEPMAAAETGWVAYEGANYYEKVTSMEDGTPYVITNTSSNYYALNRSSTSAVGRQGVTIGQNSDGTYTIETVSDSMTWYMDSDGHIYCIVDGSNYYLNASVSGSSYNRSYNLSVSTNASSEWSVSASSGNVTIRTSVTVTDYWGNTSNQTVYLRYNSGFSLSTSSNNTLSLYAKRAQAGGQARLTGTLDQTVKLSDGTTRDDILSKVTVEWDSDSDGVVNSPIAMSDCVVTGTYNNDEAGDYTLTIAYNGKTLGTVTVHVVDKSIVEGSGVLSGNTPVTTKVNMTPVFPDLKLTVTYDDGTTGVITTANGLIVSGYKISEPGIYECTVTYNGDEYGTVWVTVGNNPYEGRDEATDYPEYPADGAVRIDKHATELDFATTGLVNVELDVAGVSVRGGVDAVLTIDISNSMAWAAGTKGDDFEHNKLTDVMEAVKEFAAVLLAPGEDGTPTNNTISIVTFAGKDSDNWNNTDDYIDSVRTLVTQTSSIDVINAIAQNTKFTGKMTVGNVTDYGIQIAYVPANKNQNDVDNVVIDDPSINRGDTNYDYAFWQTEQTVDQIIAANGANSTREIHVLFMTDGCASNFNGVYYRSKNVGHAFKPGTTQTYDYYAASNGTDWTTHIMDELIAKNGGNTYAKSLYAKVDGGYAVGFDMANGAFSGITTWDSSVHWDMVFNEIVQNTVQDEDGNGMINVTNATDTATLSKFYRDLANNLRYAGTSAQTTDIIDPDFTLQMGNTTGTAGEGIGEVNIVNKGYIPTITIKTYDLVTKADLGKEVVVDGLATVVTEDMVGKTYTVDGKELEIKDAHVGTTILLDNQTVKVTETHLGMRKNTAPTAIETVTFNESGTEAYSDLIDEGKTNILSGVNGVTTINAHYFTYTNVEGVETFKWNIGNITDKEIVLSYYAYLKGSLEGEEADGLKYTNEEAILEYIDINGYYATQTFPVPAVAWGGASTAYEFYLVNEDGQPCNRQGDVVPFANRIIITGPFYQDLYLNQSDEEIAQEIIAVKVLPAGYTLYDNTAKYEVQTASGTNQGSLVISAPAAGKEQTTILVSAVTPSYIQSRVAFGVMYNMIPEDADFIMAPDKVVIDYGKSIEINVNANNDNIPDTVNVNLIGFSMFYDNVDVTQKFEDTPYSTPFEGTYGTFSIAENGNVLYTPHRMLNAPGKIFCVYKITAKTNAEDFYYMVTELDVIPATIMYYETDFATGVFTYSDNWSAPVTDSTYSVENPDGPQNDGTIGQNTYGFDTTYDDDAYLSNGSSLFAEGAGVDNTTVTFSFTGTGFDLLSRTGEKQGLIKVQVYSNASMTTLVKTVSVLNKSESDLELYQIPVVSINGLKHGTYYVKVGVEIGYNNEKFPALYRGNEFYFDAIRIYDPAQGNTIAEAAYNADGEYDNSLDEVRALLLSTETYATIEGTTTGMVYVDSTYEGGNATGTAGNVNVTDYAKVGPNNEVYLSKGQAVAFKVSATANPASFDIGAKSITGSTAGLKVSIVKNDGTTKAWSVEKTISSSTVQYIDLLSANGVNGTTVTGTVDAAQLFGNGAYVVITNTADGVLSITDLKTAFQVEEASKASEIKGTLQQLPGVSVMSTAAEAEAVEPFAVSYTVDAGTLEVARAVLTASDDEVVEPEEPVIPEEPEIDPSCNILNASVKVNGSKKNQRYTITVITSRNVEDITVMHEGKELSVSKISYKDSKKSDTRQWTIVVTGKGLIPYDSFTLTGFGADGSHGEAFEISISNDEGRIKK